MLDRPRVQQLFVTLASTAQQQLVEVLEGNTERRLDTTNGNVVLDIRPLVLQLGDRFQFVSNLDHRIPQDSAKITLLQSDELSTAQNLTQWLKAVADWIWVLVILCWAAALWLVPGRRRREVRAIGIGLVVTGVLLLVIRSVAGNYIVDNVVVTESVKPAVERGVGDPHRQPRRVGLDRDRGRRPRGRRRLADRATGRRAVAAAPLARAAPAAAGGRLGRLRVLLVLLLWLLPMQELDRRCCCIAVSRSSASRCFRRQVARETPVPVVGSVARRGRTRARLGHARVRLAAGAVAHGRARAAREACTPTARSPTRSSPPRRPTCSRAGEALRRCRSATSRERGRVRGDVEEDADRDEQPPGAAHAVDRPPRERRT